MTKRLLFFAYGLMSYMIFLGTFLYAIAFVGGIGVPARLDGPLTGSLLMALAVDCALLMVFAVQSCSQSEDVTGSVDTCAMGLYPTYNPKAMDQCVAVCKKCQRGVTTTCTTSCTLKGAH